MMCSINTIKPRNCINRRLADSEKALGKTLRIMHNLARLYQAQNRYDEAEELYKQTLMGKKEKPGTKHQST